MIRLIATPESRSAAELRRFLQRVRRPGREERRKVADAVARGIGENFSAQRAGDGPPWQELSEWTVLERLLLGYPGRRPILRRSGELRASYVQAGHPEHVEEHETTGDGWAMEVGSRDIRAGVHEFGHKTKLNTVIPARPAMLLSRRARSRIGETLDYILDEMAPG